MNTDQEQLVHLKQSFFSQFNLNIFINKISEQPAINKLIEKYPALHDEILNTSSKNDFRTHLLKLYNLFYEIESEHLQKSGQVQPKGIYHELLYLCQTSPLSNIDKWIQKTEKKYKLKVETKLFSKFKNFLYLSFPQNSLIQWLNKRYNSPVIFDTEVKKRSEEILKKFDFSYINLSACSSPKTALTFLNEFDAKATQVAKDMNMPTTHLGIHGTISLGYNKNSKDFKGGYIQETKHILMNSTIINTRTILHEWVHALDNYVCEQYTGKDKFVTQMEKVLISYDNTSLSVAFHTIRDLTQKIFNENTLAIKKQNTKYIKDFWSMVLEPNWSNYSEQEKQELLDLPLQKAVISYLTAPYKEKYNSIIIDIMTKKLNISKAKGETILFINLEKSASIAKCLQKNTANLIDKPSKYLRKSTFRSQLNKLQGIQKGYYSNPGEMMARYFESQVYNFSTTVQGLTSITNRYTEKDPDFNQIKENILNSVFNQKLDIVQRINTIRKNHNEKNYSNPKLDD